MQAFRSIRCISFHNVFGKTPKKKSYVQKKIKESLDV